jgi:hypothetical protein
VSASSLRAAAPRGLRALDLEALGHRGHRVLRHHEHLLRFKLSEQAEAMILDFYADLRETSDLWMIWNGAHEEARGAMRWPSRTPTAGTGKASEFGP